MTTRPGSIIADLTGKSIFIEPTMPGENVSTFRLVETQDEIHAAGVGYSRGVFLIVRSQRLHIDPKITIEGSECTPWRYESNWQSNVRSCTITSAYSYSLPETNAIGLAKLFDGGVYREILSVGWNLVRPNEVSVPITVIQADYTLNGDYTAGFIGVGPAQNGGVIIRERE